MEARKDAKVADPVGLVQRQLDAYNRRDLEGFLACYAPGASITAADGSIIASGGEPFRRYYRDRFTTGWAPCKLAGRLSDGAWVIDREVIGSSSGLVAFHVADGLIDRVVSLP